MAFELSPILIQFQDFRRACELSQHGNDSGDNAPPPPPGQDEGEIRVVQAKDVEREVQGESVGGSSSHLHKVLGYLLDDGIQEYRRVCRQRDATCKSLPVKLRQVSSEHVSDLMTAFPNAVELSCSTSFPSEDLDVARRLAGLTSMTRLERLDYFGDGTDGGDLQLFHSETYSRLHSLGVHLGTAEACEGFRSVLLSLTGLKRLDVTLRSDVESSTWTMHADRARWPLRSQSSWLLVEKRKQSDYLSLDVAD